MEDQEKPLREEIDPVSRKTNEEIDADEEGNLIIGGRKINDQESTVDDEDINNNNAKTKNNSIDTTQS